MLDRFVACRPHGGEAVAALSGGMQANTWNVGKQAGQLRWRIIDELLLFLSCRKAGVCMASVCTSTGIKGDVDVDEELGPLITCYKTCC